MHNKGLLPLLAAFSVGPSGLGAQSLSVDHAPGLVGTWRVVEFCGRDSTGRLIETLGPAPVGYFIYDPTGHLSIQVMRAPMSGPLSRDSLPRADLRQLRQFYFGYFGTYTVLSESTVVHHVHGGTIPEYTGTDQFRRYRIRGDTLSIGGEVLPCRVLIRERTP